MGIYITESSTDEEDISFIQELITTEKAYESNGKIYFNNKQDHVVLWEKCDKM